MRWCLSCLLIALGLILRKEDTAAGNEWMTNTRSEWSVLGLHLVVAVVAIVGMIGVAKRRIIS